MSRYERHDHRASARPRLGCPTPGPTQRGPCLPTAAADLDYWPPPPLTCWPLRRLEARVANFLWR